MNQTVEKYLVNGNILMKLVYYPDSKLFMPSDPVTEFDESLFNTLDTMTTCLKIEKGLGISAIQLGVPIRAFIMLDSRNKPIEVINPQIINTEGPNVAYREGCLSVPGKFGLTLRPQYVNVSYQDRKGNRVNNKFSDTQSVCFQHEYGHLDGVPFWDSMIREDKRYFKKKYGNQPNKV